LLKDQVQDHRPTALNFRIVMRFNPLFHYFHSLVTQYQS